MLFTSFPFLVLFFITFALYYIPKLGKYQLHLLILSSLVFYSYNDFYLVLLLLLSAGVNIITSYLVVYGKKGNRKALAIGGVAINVLILFFFKYSGLVSNLFFNPDSSLGHFLLQIPLPIGISFFTFEGISLLIDVWKEKYIDNKKIVPSSLAKHAKHTLFFISFFPHLIAGPILKAHDFYPQIGNKFFRDVQWHAAFKTLILGYFLKMVIADNLVEYTVHFNFPYFYKYSTLTLLIGVFGYSAQIFADFAGYSLIAIGLAKLFGYNFQENFNFPYISTSFKEFWKRWHISLSTFLMEYLYFPMGGNRKGKARTYLNLIITMTLGGFWHGAAWSYALWGFAHGMLLAFERFLTNNSPFSHNVFTKVLHGVFVFVAVSFLWVLFKLPDIEHVFGFAESIYENVSKRNDLFLINNILLYAVPVVLYHLVYLCKNTIAWPIFKKTEFAFYGTMLFLIMTNSGNANAFIYFQF